MTFVDTFDRNMRLEGQLELPLKRDGLEFFLRAGPVGFKYGILKTPKGESAEFTDTESMYMAVLMMVGYVTVEEFRYSVHDGNISKSTIQENISRLRKKIRKNVIRTNSRAKTLLLGYYIGELSEHRREFEIVYEGSVLNTLTGYFKLPKRKNTVFDYLRGIIMETLIKSNGKVEKSTINDRLYEDQENRDLPEKENEVLKTQVNRMNNQIGRIFIKDDGYGFYTLRPVK